jgi:hypothetical protein
MILAAVATFVLDFGGQWTCGNSNYHERWAIASHAGAPKTSQMADVVYGDPAFPDGFAYVYFVPGAREWRYDDFHADGGQSHLRSDGPQAGVWTWTGTYYPAGGAADATPFITWQRTANGTIERHFSRRINGAIVESGRDSCAVVSS